MSPIQQWAHPIHVENSDQGKTQPDLFKPAWWFDAKIISPKTSHEMSECLDWTLIYNPWAGFDEIERSNWSNFESSGRPSIGPECKVGLISVNNKINLRAALHLEAEPIRCVRGLKSSFVIGQRAQIGPNPFTPTRRADLVVWFFNLKNVCYDTAQARWIGCTQNGRPILGLEANVRAH
jgi:hypothetical protein